MLCRHVVGFFTKKSNLPIQVKKQLGIKVERLDYSTLTSGQEANLFCLPRRTGRLLFTLYSPCLTSKQPLKLANYIRILSYAKFLPLFCSFPCLPGNLKIKKAG
jgi:hypothetical protein